MKPWSERSAGERTGILIGAAAAILAALFGAQRLSAPSDVAEAPAPTEASQTAGAADTSGAAEPATPEASTEATEAAASVAEGGTAATTEDAASGTAEAEPAAEAAADTAATDTATTDAAAADTAADDGAPADETAAVPDAEAAAEAAPVAAPPLPELDLVRVSRDGSAVIAGSAAAGASVRLLLDGVEIGAVPADAQGNFVALFNLAPSTAPRVLTLSALLPDGTEIPAEGRIAIAPTVAPALAATAEAPAEATPAPEEAPAALFVTDEGARVLQTAGDLSPALAANVTVDAITYSPEGAVQLAGRGTGGAVVRLYLDNAQVADTAVDGQGGWAVTLGDVAPGLYTLRADQIDAAGKVTSRFETPFQRETLEALAAAAAAQAGGDDATGAGTDEAVAPAEASTDAAAADGAGEDAAAETATAETAGTADVTTADATADANADASAEAGADADAGAGADAGADAGTAPVSITVQPGFTLWRIARENLGDGILYVQVFEANKAQIRDPDLIYPGQVFTIPAAE